MRTSDCGLFPPDGDYVGFVSCPGETEYVCSMANPFLTGSDVPPTGALLSPTISSYFLVHWRLIRRRLMLLVFCFLLQIKNAKRGNKAESPFFDIAYTLAFIRLRLCHFRSFLFFFVTSQIYFCGGADRIRANTDPSLIRLLRILRKPSSLRELAERRDEFSNTGPIRWNFSWNRKNSTSRISSGASAKNACDIATNYEL